MNHYSRFCPFHLPSFPSLAILLPSSYTSRFLSLHQHLGDIQEIRIYRPCLLSYAVTWVPSGNNLSSFQLSAFSFQGVPPSFPGAILQNRMFYTVRYQFFALFCIRKRNFKQHGLIVRYEGQREFNGAEVVGNEQPSRFPAVFNAWALKAERRGAPKFQKHHGPCSGAATSVGKPQQHEQAGPG